MAGRNGANCDAKVLVLNHISPKMEDNLSGLVHEAYNSSQQKLSVLVSFDFMELVIPWLGFGPRTATTRSTEGEECDFTSDTTVMKSEDSKYASK